MSNNKKYESYSDITDNLINYNKFFKSTENISEKQIKYNKIIEKINKILKDNYNPYKRIIIEYIINKILNKNKINNSELNVIKEIIIKISEIKSKDLNIYSTILLIIDNIKLFKLNDEQKKIIIALIEKNNNILINDYLEKYGEEKININKKINNFSSSKLNKNPLSNPLSNTLSSTLSSTFPSTLSSTSSRSYLTNNSLNYTNPYLIQDSNNFYNFYSVSNYFQENNPLKQNIVKLKTEILNLLEKEKLQNSNNLSQITEESLKSSNENKKKYNNLIRRIDKILDKRPNINSQNEHKKNNVNYSNSNSISTINTMNSKIYENYTEIKKKASLSFLKILNEKLNQIKQYIQSTKIHPTNENSKKNLQFSNIYNSNVNPFHQENPYRKNLKKNQSNQSNKIIVNSGIVNSGIVNSI